MTKNNYSFEPLPYRGQSRLKVTMPSGECIVLTFSSSFPLQASDYYIQVIERALESQSADNVDYFNLFTRACAQNLLEMPISVGFDRDYERMRIGVRLKEIREKKGMTALQLALKANIDPANLCRIEQGKYSAGLDVLCKLANALGSRLDIVELL